MPDGRRHAAAHHPDLRCRCGEIGKNMYCFEYGEDIVVIDCGLMFPDEEMFGIDLVVPDVTYLRERRANVRAFVITHAHEDHVGGLPYVLPDFPGVPIYASTLARGLLGNKIREHKLHNNPMRALRKPRLTRDSRSGGVPGDRLPYRPLHPRRDGHRPAHAAGHGRPYRRLQVRPHAGGRQALRLRPFGQAGGGGRALPAVRLDARREPRLHALRAHGWRGLPRDHGAPRWPGHRRDLCQQHRPRPAGPRRGRRHAPQRVGHRPVDGAELPDRERPRLPELPLVADRRQGPDQHRARRQARHRDHRRPGRAHVRPGPDGEPRPPIRGDRTRRYRHRQREPHPRQRGVRLAHHRQPLQGRRERHLSRHPPRTRLRTRQPGGVEVDAGADEAPLLHPDPRRVPDAGPARPPGRRDGRPRRITSSSSRTAMPIEFLPDGTAHRRRGAPAGPRATSTSTGSRSAKSGRSCSAIDARSRTTACS